VPAKPRPKQSLEDHAAGVERLLHILGYKHLRARAARGAVYVESGPADDPFPHLRLRPTRGEDWRVDFPKASGRWEASPIEGPRGNVIAEVHQFFAWLLHDVALPG
jgi:hypothetical protein